MFSPDLIFRTFTAFLRAPLLNHGYHQAHLVMVVILMAIAMMRTIMSEVMS